MQDVQSLIRQAHDENWEELDLSGMELTDLPQEIKRLTGLRTLVLGKYDRTTYRRVGNNFTEIPTIVFELTQLENLLIASNEITEIPESIGQLTNLTQFDLSRNYIGEIPDSIGQLTNLTQLYLSSNPIREIPDSIGQLTNLTQLYLSRNFITEIPDSIGQLINLTLLDLHSNQITEIPEWIGQLTNLTQLDLHSNEITEIPEWIGQLTNLTWLDLGSNPIREIPEWIGQPTNLTQLDLSSNEITEIPEWIGQLTNLTWLDLGSNEITEIPEWIGQLTNLTWLDLGSNEITEIPEWIGQLTNLTQLDLSFNEITEIPEWIGQLINLSQLYLYNNQITEISESIGQLINLKCLALENNAIQNVPPEIIRKGWGEHIFTYGEPQIIFAYLKSIQNSKRPLNELKVLLVGEGNVGKTSLIKRLRDNSFNANERKTQGIKIHPWKLNVNQQTININFWDFGGQEIMHATHQFFLTKRSIYLLVLKNRETDEQNRLEYWLEIINSLSNESPILIIGNQSDQHPLDTNEKHYKDKYPNIKGFISTSCETGDGIQTLIETLTHIITTLPHIHTPIPETWFKLKQKLETLGKDYIPYSDYSNLCQTHNIPEPTEQTNLLRLLHDLGTVLNFAHNDHLQDTNVLNPTWVTKGIYAILNDNNLITHHKGILPRSELSRILDSDCYPESKHRFILDMMQEFELCIPLESKNQWLIPDLLPKGEPDTGDWNNTLQFQYHYNILPQSIISRFIVRMSHCISKDTYWRTGVVLSDQENRAIVRADLYDRIISIAISGNPSTRRAFLHTIRNCFQSIHRTLEKLNVKEKVPLPEDPKIIVDYQQLLTHERKGRPELIPEGYDELVNVKTLLDGIEIPDIRRKNDRDRYDDPKQEFHFHMSPTFNNQQDQTMTDNKTWNGDRVENKFQGDQVMGNKMQIDTVQGDAIAGNKIINSQNLAQAAQDIKALLDQISATDTSNNPTLVAIKAIESIEKNPTLKDRIVNAGKEAGFAALEAAVDHPAVKIVTAALKGAMS